MLQLIYPLLIYAFLVGAAYAIVREYALIKEL